MSVPAYVGRYEIKTEIARGAFAAVYLAWDEELESRVAIKVLLDRLARDAGIQGRFVDEARLLRRVNSPHVIAIHDIGRLDDGRPYLVLDYADRGTLVPRLVGSRRQDSAATQALLTLVDALAEGLGAIHNAGLVHRDIKPANILLQSPRGLALTDTQVGEGAQRAPLLLSDERVLVGDLGIAKDITRNGEVPTIVGGTPLYLAPEQNDPQARITAATDVYAATAVVVQCLTGRRPPSPEQLQSALAPLPASWQAALAQGMHPRADQRYNDIDQWRHAMIDAAVQDAVTDARDLDATPLPQRDLVCPYKGLASYQLEDAHLFCGREGLVDELLRRLQLHKVLVVGGPSGSGKSSLVRAGLLPALRDGAIPRSEDWRTVVIRPGLNPLEALASELPQTLAIQNGNGKFDTQAVARAVSTLECPTLIFVDQFEELFTLSAPVDRKQCLALLAALTDPAEGLLRLVIAVRADFYEACATFPWLARRITENQVLVGPMNAAEMRRAISEPARRVGLYLERELIDAVVEEAGSEAGALPLVGHALVETWVRREGNLLTLEGYRAVGGVAGAISQTADSVYEHSFTPQQRKIAKHLLLGLVAPGEGVADTRRLVDLNEIGSGEDPLIAQGVVDELARARLLTLDEHSVQIAHEALLRTWPRLRHWIEDSRDDLRTRHKVEHAAAEWLASDRDPDLLYRGAPLLSATDWAERNADHLGATAQYFLTTSAEVESKAQSEAQAQQRRRRRLSRYAIASLLVLTLGATLASIIAFRALHDAQRNEELARAATSQAESRFAGALGSAAYGRVEQYPRLALILAAESMRRSHTQPPSFDARAAMLSARLALSLGGPTLRGSAIAAGDSVRLAMSPDGSLLAAGQRDGSIYILNTLVRHAPLILEGHQGSVRDLDFDRSGRHLVSGATDGTVRYWDLEAPGGASSTLVGQAGDVIMSVCIDPDGQRVAAASGDGSVRLWRLEDGQQSKTGAEGMLLDQRPYEYDVVEFGPDGSLYAVYREQLLSVWDGETGQLRNQFSITGHTGHLLDIDFNPAGTHFATVSSDGSSLVFDARTGQLRETAFQNTARIGGVRYGADGRVLVGGGHDGRVRAVYLGGQDAPETSVVGHAQPIIDMVASGDRALMATLGRDQQMRLWTYGKVQALAAQRKVASGKAKGLALSPDGMRVAVGDSGGGLSIWELGRERAALQIQAHKKGVWAVAFSTNGELIASSDRTGEIRIWEASTGYLRQSFHSLHEPVWSLQFLPGGEQLLAAGESALAVLSLRDGSLLRTLEPKGGAITRSAVSFDSAWLGASYNDGMVRVWNLSDWSLRSEIKVVDDIVWSLAFSRDGKTLATALSNETVTTWDLRSGQRLAVFGGFSGGATDVGFLADAVTLVAVDRSGDLHWWDLQTGRRLTDAWPAHDRTSWRLALHPNGEQFATTGDDGVVKVWDAMSVQRACDIGKPTFDEQRRTQYLGPSEQLISCSR